MRCLLAITIVVAIIYSNCAAQEWSTPEAMQAFGKPGDTVNPDTLGRQGRYSQENEIPKAASRKKKKKQDEKKEAVIESPYVPTPKSSDWAGGSVTTNNNSSSSHERAGNKEACLRMSNDIRSLLNNRNMDHCYKADSAQNIYNASSCGDTEINSNVRDAINLFRSDCKCLNSFNYAISQPAFSSNNMNTSCYHWRMNSNQLNDTFQACRGNTKLINEVNKLKNLMLDNCY